MNRNPLLAQNSRRFPIGDVELFLWRCTKSIDQNGDHIAGGKGKILQNPCKHRLHRRINRLQLRTLNARLAMDAHTDLHLIIADGEGCLSCLRNDARRQCDAHRARIVDSLLCNTRDLIQRKHPLSGCTRDLIRKYKPCNAAALILAAFRGRCDIIRHKDFAHLDIIHLAEIFCHTEVHDIAAIATVEMEHTGAAVGSLVHLVHILRTWRSKYIADRHPIAEPIADIAEKHGEMPGAAARCDSNLADLLLIGAHHAMPAVIKDFQLIRMSGNDAFHGLACKVLGTVDQFLHR